MQKCFLQCGIIHQGHNKLKYVFLFLLGPPYIVSPPENVTVNISQNALFTCQAEAYPGNLTYTWFWEEDNVYFKK